MMADQYEKAKKAGDQAFQKALHEGRHPYLPVLTEFLDEKKFQSVSVGTMEIPLSLVIGTRTAGRQSAFACNFMPLMERESEFGNKWQNLYDSQVEEGMRDPVLVYEYLHYFYVQEGNKRVSVAKFLNMPSISAEIRRLVPIVPEQHEPDIYDEFLKFYSVCPLYELNFSKQGSYLKFARELDLDLKAKWPEMTVSQVRGAFYNFQKAYTNPNEEPDSKKVSDAFLIYISLYGFEKIRYQSVQTARKNIQTIRKELATQTGQDNIAVKENPQEKKEAPLLDIRRIIPAYTESKPLRIAFVYDENAEDSAWVYDHEIGRRYLNKKFPAIVKTDCYENCGTEEELEKILAKAAKTHDMIFTVSPAMMAETLKAAIHSPAVHFLNCSINLSANAVRSYYVRMYEVKFLMGALAAMHADNHKVCYIADYPIYGTIASINAFAIGASLIDPEIKVYLGWSSIHDQDWFRELDDLGINVFSGPELSSLKEDSTVFGLCRKEKDGSVTNLATPVINWAKYYETLVTTELEGSWNQEDDTKKMKAINYWWGMNAGVLDINISSAVHYSSAKMIRLMTGGLVSGTLNPFAGELRAQNRVIQDAKAGRLSNEAIINMDWLNDNVIGVIPEYHRLSEGGKKLAEVSGVSAAKEKI